MHEGAEFPRSSHGKPAVTGWVIGVVDDAHDAAELTRAVEAAGFPADRVVVETGAAALRQVQARQAQQRQAGLLARAFDAVEEAFEGREPARQVYESEAQRGRTFVGVHMQQEDQLDGLRNIFVAHGAHAVYVFRPTGIGQLA
jgi:hypothetical protein